MGGLRGESLSLMGSDSGSGTGTGTGTGLVGCWFIAGAAAGATAGESATITRRASSARPSASSLRLSCRNPLGLNLSLRWLVLVVVVDVVSAGDFLPEPSVEQEVDDVLRVH